MRRREKAKDEGREDEAKGEGEGRRERG